MKSRKAGSAVLAVALAATMCWPAGMAVAEEAANDGAVAVASQAGQLADGQIDAEDSLSDVAVTTGTLNLGRFRNFVSWTSNHFSSWSINIVDTGVPDGVDEVDLSTEQDGSIIGWKVARTGDTGCAGTSYDYYVSAIDPGVKVKGPAACSSMFTDAGISLSLSMDLTGLDVSRASNMASMFSGLTGLKSLDITGWDTSHVTNMASMFSGCVGLSDLKGVDALNVSSVTSFSGMFRYCGNLMSLDLSKWNTSSCTSLDSMFAQCTNLVEADVSNFATSNVTTTASMFSHCSSLMGVDMASWDTMALSDASSMFASCTSLYEVDMSSWYTPALKQTQSMFSRCSSLSHVYVGYGWTTEQVSRSTSMFYNCWMLPNYDDTCVDKTYAYAGGDGLGYLSYKSAPVEELFAIATTEPVSCGKKASFTCNIVGARTSAVTYQWQYRTSESGAWRNCATNGCKTRVYSAKATSVRAGYEYRCVVVALDGRKAVTQPISFDVALSATATTAPVELNSYATFKCAVTGNGSYRRHYQWQVSTDGGLTWENSQATSAQKATLKVMASSVVVEDGYLYRCVVTCGAWTACTEPIAFSIVE